jgi:hypothetical protein
VGLLDALASPVGCKYSLLLGKTAIGIATGHLPQGVPNDAIRSQAHRGQQVYESNLETRAGGKIGHVRLGPGLPG